MKLYLNVVDNKILNVDIEKGNKCNTEVDLPNIDEFFDYVMGRYEYDDEIEETVKELLENSNGEMSLESFDIKHWVSNRSFGELIDMYVSGEIIKPEMQREFVWDAQKCSRLIESIILGLPIPPLFLLEVESNKYELIDGFQRLTTLVNFVNGKPWNGGIDGKRSVSSKLSGRVSKEIIGLSYDKLCSEHQRIIKRSTIPLIEFKQLGPNNLSSKYLIFERINTGSEKLNQMQIRKSLAHGKFISHLYIDANNCIELRALFSGHALKKDQHVEAYLRTIALSSIFYDGKVILRSGINNILNDFCEEQRQNEIPSDYIESFSKAINFASMIFENSTNMFRRVEKDENGNLMFSGNLNIAILESMLGVIIQRKLYLKTIDFQKTKKKYMYIMYETLEDGRSKKVENPFSTSTGTEKAIKSRFAICEKFFEE